jgi:hypothetical protein
MHIIYTSYHDLTTSQVCKYFKRLLHHIWVWYLPTIWQTFSVCSNKVGYKSHISWGVKTGCDFLVLQQVIIRSHEGPDSIACQKGFKNMLEGYSTDHEVESGKLYTLFSAPDYPQVYISFCTSLFFTFLLFWVKVQIYWGHPGCLDLQII